MENKTPKGAILQRDKKSFAVVPKIPVGLLSADQLETIASVVRKFNIPLVKITSGQRIALIGMKEEDVELIWQDLKMEPGSAQMSELCVHYVQACPGTDVCIYGLQDSIGLGKEVDKIFSGLELPAKVKIGISGCPFCCGESFVRDIGIMGKKSGWTLILGGNSARRARIGDVVAEFLSDKQIIDLIKRFLDYYIKNAKRKERTARFVDRMGIEEIKEMLLT